MRNKTFGCGFGAFIMVFAVGSFLCSQLTMFSYSMRQMGDYGGDANYRDSSQVSAEVWKREITPGFVRQACYTTDAATCKAADGALRETTGASMTDGNFGMIFGGSILIALVIAIFYRWFLYRSARKAEPLGAPYD